LSTKGELISGIEGLLGVKLSSLDRMTRGDLEKLYAVLSNPRSLLAIGLRARKDEVESIAEALGLPEPPIELSRISDILEDPLKGLSLLLELSKKLSKEEEK
jgi:hypothetical protein